MEGVSRRHQKLEVQHAYTTDIQLVYKGMVWVHSTLYRFITLHYTDLSHGYADLAVATANSACLI